MKKIYSLVTGLLLTVSVLAQAPQKMSYQALIRNSSNVLLTSVPVGMRISVLQGTSTGTAVYVETQTPSTNANGLVSLEIGSGTPTIGTFAAINWANGPYFIKTETDPTGGTVYTIAGTNQLMSVPYALFSANGTPGPIGLTGPTGATGLIAPGTTAGNTTYWNGSAWVTNSSNIFNNGANVGIGTLTPNSKLEVNGAAKVNGSLDVSTTTGALIMPRMNTSQRNAISSVVPGMVIYNTDVKKFQGCTDNDYTGFGQADASNENTNTIAPLNFAQSYTCMATGKLTAVVIILSSIITPGNCTFTLYSGSGTGGTVLVSYTATIINDGQYQFTIPGTVLVTSGNVYTFEVLPVGGTECTARLFNANSYAGGNAFIGGIPDLGKDFYFRTSINPFITPIWADFH